MTNTEIAKIFNETADILEIQGAIIFRVRAYRNAARVIDNLTEKLSDIVARNPDELNSIKSIGKALHDKIIEFCQTGKIKVQTSYFEFSRFSYFSKDWEQIKNIIELNRFDECSKKYIILYWL